jgi:hypothetical protein
LRGRAFGGSGVESAVTAVGASPLPRKQRIWLAVAGSRSWPGSTRLGWNCIAADAPTVSPWS